MIIGIDLTPLDPNHRGGVTRFSLDITKSLIDIRDKDQIVIFANNKNVGFIKENIKNLDKFKIELVNKSNINILVNKFLSILSWITKNYKIRKWWEKYFRKEINEYISQAVHIYYSPTTLLNFFNLSIPTLVSIHDIQHEDLPENFSLRERVGRWSHYKATCIYASCIQVSSKFIFNSIHRNYKEIQGEKIKIIPEGVSKHWFVKKDEIFEKPAINDQFVFYPAQLWAHKNHVQLIEAANYIKNKYKKEINFILTGSDKGMLNLIKEKIDRYDIKNIYYLGVVSDKEIRALYFYSSLVISLSSYESSCLPIKEAIAMGKNVLVSDIEPNIELANDIGINLYKQGDISDLAEKIYYYSNCKNKLAIEPGIVKKFEWNLVAEQYMENFRRLGETN
jgi:hypothetical protein